jgi:hypothetical protein
MTLYVALSDKAVRRHFQFSTYPSASDDPSSIDAAPYILEVLRQSPTDFTFTTESHTYNVHSYIVQDLFLPPSDLHAWDPNTTSISLPDDIPHDILTKFVSVITGGTETFPRSEYKIAKRILGALRPRAGAFPIWFMPSTIRFGSPPLAGLKPMVSRICILPGSLVPTLGRWRLTFQITTRAQAYSIPLFSIGFSKVLSAYRDARQFDFDYADEGGVFGLVRAYLCGSRIQITAGNMHELKAIAASLEIDGLSASVDRMIRSFERNQKVLEVEQDTFEADLCLHELLFRMPPERVACARDELLGSSWFLDDEHVKEFVSNLLLAAAIRPNMAPELATLVGSLAESQGSDFFLRYLERRVLAEIATCDSSRSIARFTFCLFEAGLISGDHITRALFVHFTEWASPHHRPGSPRGKWAPRPASGPIEAPAVDGWPIAFSGSSRKCRLAIPGWSTSSCPTRGASGAVYRPVRSQTSPPFKSCGVPRATRASGRVRWRLTTSRLSRSCSGRGASRRGTVCGSARLRAWATARCCRTRRTTGR